VGGPGQGSKGKPAIVRKRMRTTGGKHDIFKHVECAPFHFFW
jgi:hypothetical protein